VIAKVYSSLPVLCYDVRSCIIESCLHMNETTDRFFSLCWWEGPKLMSCCEEDER